MNKFIFFGTDDFSIEVLKVLIENGYRPEYCITQPDRPKGRNLVLTPPDIKIFCEKENIKVLQFEKLNPEEIPETDFYIVASYGKIISKEVLDKPKLGALNVHPSLLPKYRGATPIESAILNDDKNTGVTIILMDEKMDHGPIVSQKEINFEKWPSKIEARNKLAKIGGELLLEAIKNINNLKTKEQDHSKATFTKMTKKPDGEILESDSEKTKWLKFIAYNPWPGVFFFIYPEQSREADKNIRVKITDAKFDGENFEILKVIPEGKKEMSFESFKNGYLK